MQIYVVRSGDTLSSVARYFSVSPDLVAVWNGLRYPYRLAVGQSLVILSPTAVHYVRKGDTLYSIAREYGTTVGVLYRLNPRFTSLPLRVGNEVVVSVADNPTRAVRIGGYAYPFANRSIIRSAMPFLSSLTVFGYGFTSDGELIYPDDSVLLSYCREFGVTPVLLLSSITENGGFSSERASALFSSPALTDTVLYRIADVMDEKGYRILDIDFEYVKPEDSDAFLAFIRSAVEIMHGRGYTVNVDLAPKYSATQAGLLYEAHDYGAIGAVADSVFLMTYEWGYTYGPPMAVAPLNQVERIVEYAVTEIPKEKISLGIPNYGYDWPLPFEKGITRATSLGHDCAVETAVKYKADIAFPSPAESPTFVYTSDKAHEVWFEDARSYEAKYRLFDKYGIAGFGYWNLMRSFDYNLSLLSGLYLPLAI